MSYQLFPRYTKPLSIVCLMLLEKTDKFEWGSVGPQGELI